MRKLLKCSSLILLLISCCCVFKAQAVNLRKLNNTWHAAYAQRVGQLSDKGYYLAKVRDYSGANNLADLCGYYLRACELLIERGEYITALQLLGTYDNDVRAASASSESRIAAMNFKNDMGVCYLHLGAYQKAIEAFNQQLNEARKLALNKQTVLAYENLHYIYLEQGDTVTAKDMLGKAISIGGSHSYPSMSGLYNNLALICQAQGNYDDAIKNYQLALTTKFSKGFDNSFIMTNLGVLYEQMGRLAEAEKELQQAIDRQSQQPFNASNIETEQALARVKQRLGKRGEAERLIRLSDGHIASISDSETKADYLKQSALLHQSDGDLRGAMMQMTRYVAMNDSIKSQSNAKLLNQIMTAYQVEQLRNQNLAITHESDLYKAQSRNRAVVSILTIIIAIFFAVALVMGIRKRKKERYTHSLILQQQQQIREFEQKEAQRKMQGMQENLSFKNRELTAFALEMSGEGEFLKSIRAKLKKLKSIDADSQAAEMGQQLEDIIHDLELHSQVKLGEDFRKYFTKVSPSFFTALQQRHGSLTPKDQRLCALIYLGLSSKEVAALLSQEVNTVDMSRKRLRKKLCLDSDTNLCQYLHSLVDSTADVP